MDKELVAEYNRYYLKTHPRAKKDRIDHPYHPSINKWFILQRPALNNLKQNWKGFIMWWMNKEGYSNMMLDDFEVEYDIYHPTNRRTDTDNYTPKFIHDGFVESGFWSDDDRTHLKSLTIRCHVDKENPRTDIKIRIKDKKEDENE